MSGDASAEQKTTGLLKDGWFTEINEQWPGIANSLQVEEVLWDKKSDYQHVQVFKTHSFGNALILDGVIQVTEKDEMAYQEMITHLAMFSHKNPERVLVIGGGDGGVLREVCRHPSVKQVTICEIDQMVIDVSRKYLPNVACGYNDPRVTVHRGDAAEFILRPENVNYWDVIVSDTSDPVGPAAALFESSFYEKLHSALRAGGRAITQGESVWLHLDLIVNLVKNGRKIFASCEYASTQIPTYPCGQIGFIVCAKADEADKHPSCKQPVREVPEAIQSQLRYYSADLHRAAFVLPYFAVSALKK